MKKTTMNTKTQKPKVSRLTSLLATALLVLLPASGVGNLATAAYAGTGDQDTSLKTFTVNGTSVADGDTVNVDYGTTSVDVVATPNNVDATVEISGDTGLVTGPNAVSVVVTAADQTTTQNYSVTVDVASNNDTSLGIFTINGDDATSGSTVNLDYGTKEVDVIAEPADVEATVSISGDSGLVVGSNTLTVVVTAANGTDTQTYTVTLQVSDNNDASLGVFAIPNSFSC